MARSAISNFLADTWWYGLTTRLSRDAFERLAALRADQGFSAVQLVVGIPPEVGPQNENARSEVGTAWAISGEFNSAYLSLARDRIRTLNNLGLTVAVYGAWGHQIAWLGEDRMAQWWLELITALDALDVIYVLCGESNLWVGRESMLLPDKSTDDLARRWVRSQLGPRLADFIRRFANRVDRQLGLRSRLRREKLERRRRAWGYVLERISTQTERPILVHPTSTETGYEAVPNPGRLSANTAQTGHDPRARNRIWRLPLELSREGRAVGGYVNLEPWYEGIGGRFWGEDQLFAYWASMLAGATAHCYGAHGVWNVGDGAFLSHWGDQTFEQAVALDTPRLLGLSHAQYLDWLTSEGESFYQEEDGDLISIGRRSPKGSVSFFPEVSRAPEVPQGQVWLPMAGNVVGTVPADGQVVVFSRFEG